VQVKIENKSHKGGRPSCGDRDVERKRDRARRGVYMGFAARASERSREVKCGRRQARAPSAGGWVASEGDWKALWDSSALFTVVIERCDARETAGTDVLQHNASHASK
jgi:hypothetical protein